MGYLKLVAIILGLVIIGGAYYARHQALVDDGGTTSTVSIFRGEQLDQNKLDLSGRGLREVPEYVFSEIGLEVLDLSDNQLTGAVQGEIRFLKNLRELDLGNNLMTGVPAEIGQLENLRILDLSNNKLTGLPYELGNLENLEMFDISGNEYSEHDLSVIEEGLPSLVKIVK